MRMFLLACVVGINALAAASLEVRVLSEGQLAIPGGEISLDAFSAGWKGARGGVKPRLSKGGPSSDGTLWRQACGNTFR